MLPHNNAPPVAFKGSIMAFSSAEIRELIGLLTPIFISNDQRRALLFRTFPNDSEIIQRFNFDQPARDFTAQVIESLYRNDRAGLLVLLHVIQEYEGGELARNLTPFIHRVEGMLANAEPRPTGGSPAMPRSLSGVLIGVALIVVIGIVVMLSRQGLQANTPPTLSPTLPLTETSTLPPTATATPTTPFTETPTTLPTATTTPTVTETLTTPFTETPVLRLKAYPCPANITTTRGEVLNVVQQTPSGGSRQSVRAGQNITLLTRTAPEVFNAMYKIADSNTGRELGWIAVEYVVPSTNCP